MRDIVDSMHTINMKLYKSVNYCKNTKIFIFHITCVETVKALLGLHKFKAAPETPLLAHAFTIITWIGQSGSAMFALICLYESIIHVKQPCYIQTKT